MTSASSIPSTSGSGGEKKIPVVTDFFLKDLEKDVWVCQVKTGDNAKGEPQRCLCKLSVSADSHKGTRAYNRKRHIRRSHMDVWDEWQQAEKEAEKRKALARKALHGLQGCQIPRSLHCHFNQKPRPLWDHSRPPNLLLRPLSLPHLGPKMVGHCILLRSERSVLSVLLKNAMFFSFLF